MTNIIFDCDGVLLDWEHGFSRWLWDIHRIQCKTSRPHSWDLSEWVGLNNDEVFHLIKEFNKSPQFAHLYEYTDSAVFVRDMWKLPNNLFVLSTYDSGGKSQMNRIYNLHQKFGNVFEEIVSLPLRQNKRDALEILYSKCEGPCIYIEDNHSHAYEGRKVGHDCYVLRRDHNRQEEANHGNLKGLTWVDNFQQIREAVIK